MAGDVPRGFNGGRFADESLDLLAVGERQLEYKIEYTHAFTVPGRVVICVLMSAWIKQRLAATGGGAIGQLLCSAFEMHSNGASIDLFWCSPFPSPLSPSRDMDFHEVLIFDIDNHSHFI